MWRVSDLVLFDGMAGDRAGKYVQVRLAPGFWNDVFLTCMSFYGGTIMYDLTGMRRSCVDYARLYCRVSVSGHTLPSLA